MNESDKHMVFRLGQSYYGTKLSQIREVSKPIKYQVVPNSIPACLGIINIRGLQQ